MPQVYHTYKPYGSGPIPFECVNLEDYSAAQTELLDEVWRVYGVFTASKLETMTHNEPPWMNTPQNDAIPHSIMTEFFKTLVVDDGEGPVPKA